jgi:hypothetical protein
MSRAALATITGLLVITMAGAALLLSDDAVAPEASSVAQGSDGPTRLTELPPQLADEPATPSQAVPLRAEPSEREPMRSTAAPPDEPIPLTVVVVHFDRTPAKGGRVELRDEQGALVGEGVLDDEGRWQHPGFDGPAKLLVLGVAAQDDPFEFSHSRGLQFVTLRDGPRLEGLVLVDGAPPATPFPLRVTTVVSAPVRDAHGEPAIRAKIPGELSSIIRRGFLTDAAGRFQFSGMQHGDEVELEWPQGYELDPAYPGPFPLVAPASGVVLALTSPFFIRGRVVHPDGTPAGSARLTMEVKTTERSTSGSSSRSSGYDDAKVAPDGRFAVAVPSLQGSLREDDPDAPESEAPTLDVDVVATTEDGSAATGILSDASVGRDHDLGDLVLQPPQLVTLLVIAPDASPVAGAQVRPEARRQTLPPQDTDDEGQVLVDLAAADAGCATIVARGFQTQRVQLPPVAPGHPIQVVLVPSTSVVVEALGPWDQAGLEDGWRFDMSVVAQESAFHDVLLPPIPGHASWQGRGPDPLRESPEGFAGSSGSSSYGDGTREQSWVVGVPRMLFDGLRANHALRIRIEIRDAPEAFGELPEDASWESAEVWVGDGERRELVADLRYLQPAG